MTINPKQVQENEDEIEKYSSNDKVSELEDLKKRINSIKNCELKNSATKIVFSDGNLLSKIMIVGEGPGANEDKEGKTLCGKSGKTFRQNVVGNKTK